MEILRHGFGKALSSQRVRSAVLALVGIVAATVTGWIGMSSPATAVVQTIVGEPMPFSCATRQATLQQQGVPGVTIGTSRIYIGYQQVSADNKNPIIIRFNNGRRVWCRTDIEVTGDDGEGYGLLWNGGNLLYGVFSATGTQGTANQDYRRFTAAGWLRSYGNGGGPQVSVVLRLNPTTGQPIRGTFVTAQLSSGRSNSLVVRNLSWTGSSLLVTSDAWFSPRRTNRQPFACTGSSPFRYQLWLSPDLSRALRARAERCQ